MTDIQKDIIRQIREKAEKKFKIALEELIIEHAKNLQKDIDNLDFKIPSFDATEGDVEEGEDGCYWGK